MQIKEYLEKYQPIVYKTFTNALLSGRLSHAYLLSGHTGMPLKESAIFLAKSLLCDNPSPLACETCITCLRVDEGNYADLMIIDGEVDKIKRADVERIMNNFDKTALEEKGIMIYILHLVETMTANTVNTILKFLEEPGKNVYAFLTTENESKILPTILSRTQIFRFNERPQQEVIDEALSYGVSNEDAEMLSYFYNDGETIKAFAQTPEYQAAINALNEQLEAMLINADNAIYVCQRHIIPQIKDRNIAKIYVKMLTNVFQDLVNISVNQDITLKSYDKILHELSGILKNIDKSLIILMSTISKIDLNVNIPLILDHLIYEITKGAK